MPCFYICSHYAALKNPVFFICMLNMEIVLLWITVWELPLLFILSQDIWEAQQSLETGNWVTELSVCMPAWHSAIATVALLKKINTFVILLDGELGVKYERRAWEALGMYFPLSDSRCNNISFAFVEFPTEACWSEKTGVLHEVESSLVLFWKNEKGTACSLGVVLVRRCHVMWMWYWSTF